MIFVFWMWRFKSAFSVFSFTFIKRLFSSSLLSAVRVVSFACVCVSHSVMSDFATPWTTARQDSLSFIIYRSLLKLMSIESVIPSNHLILCHPLLLPSIKSGGQNIGAWASASVLPMNIQDWFPLGLTAFISLQSKGLSRCLLQYHGSKASILQHSAFFMVQLSHPHMTTGNTIAVTRRIFVSKVMSLLFNMLPRLVIVYLPRSKCLFISWLQSPSAVILESKKVMYVNCTSIKIFF